MVKRGFCKPQTRVRFPYPAPKRFMSYERFSELWDIFVGNRQKNTEITPTLQALIDYAHGDKRKLEAIRVQLNNDNRRRK